MDPLSPSIITNSQVNPLILTGVVTLLAFLVLSYHNSGAWKLRKFPTVGSSLPVLSLIGRIKYIQNTPNVVATGKRKASILVYPQYYRVIKNRPTVRDHFAQWPGRLFKIPYTAGWQVIITDPTHLADLRKAPEHVLSANKSLQSRFTFNPHVAQNRIQIPIIRTRLTKETPGLVADVHDEVVEACNRFIPANDEWTSVAVLDTMRSIVARAANRIFVGPVLCRNPEWIKLGIEYATDIIKTAFLIRAFPSFMRPPSIAVRRNEPKTETFNDFLSWLIDESKGKDREDWAIAARILGLNFAAIHTTSMAVTHALYDLASNPEYLKQLREEVDAVTSQEGWTKAALDQMYRIDSFLKESQRLNPVGALMMGRCALVDYTFTDGTFIPAGTTLGVCTSTVNLDPRTYEDPMRFDGFRFLRMKEDHPDRKFDFVSISSDFVAFGQGRHACPGRFFASAELKIVLAHIVKTYDVQLVDGARPPNLFCMNGILPNQVAKIYFRRRQ